MYGNLKVRDYSDKAVYAKRLGFDSENFRNMGAEIEVLPYKGYREEVFAAKLFNSAHQEFSNGEFVLKRDGSLMDDFGYWNHDGEYENLNGLEIVTGVMGPEFVTTYDWGGMFHSLGRCCYPIKSAMNVGLHIHVDRRWGAPVGQSPSRSVAMVATYLVDTMSQSEILRIFGRHSIYARNAPIFKLKKRGLSGILAKAKSLAYAGLISTDFTNAWQFDKRNMYVNTPVFCLSARQLRDERTYSEYYNRSNRTQLVNVENKDTIEFRGFLSPNSAAQFEYATSLVTSMMDFASHWVYGKDKRLPNWEYFLERYPRFAHCGFANLCGD